MSVFLDSALQYARRGWAVLPLARCNKVPAIKGGCRSATDDASTVQAWWEGHPDHNVAIATGTPSLGLVVVDIDVDGVTGEDGMETLTAWEAEHGELPTTVTAITGRGGLHMYYRCNTPIGCSVNKDLGVDVRGDGGFVVAPPSIHPNGRAYCWENDPGEYAVAEADDNVYAFIRHVQGERRRSERFVLPDTIGKGERNDTLFRYASSLHEQGYDDVYIRIALDAVNTGRCDKPLPDSEVGKIVESVTKRYEKGKVRAVEQTPGKKAFRKPDRNGNPTGPVLHNVVGAELIEVNRARFIDGAPAVWDGGRYVPGWDGVNRAIVDLIDDCKMADQREIRNYVHLKAPRVGASPPENLAFSNGVLNILDGTLRTDPTLVITNVVPHEYDPEAYDAHVDDFLDSVSCGDALVRKNLEEVVGLCMYRSNEFGQCPVLIGMGSNGKSTYLLALRNVLGEENVSSLDINVVGKPFQAGRLLGRLANLGDDISNERLNGDVLAVFKKIVTGEWIYTDVKNSDGFEFKPYCTLIFSCNEFPSLGDSSEGMMRRLFPIPFDAHFSKSDPGYDPRLIDKLTSEEAAKYLIRLGVEGLMRARAANGLTPNVKSDELVVDVRTDNDSVLQWIADQGLDHGFFVSHVIAERYDLYKEWCEDSRLFPFSRSKFTRKVNARYGLQSVPERRDYANGSRTVRVFR